MRCAVPFVRPGYAGHERGGSFKSDVVSGAANNVEVVSPMPGVQLLFWMVLMYDGPCQECINVFFSTLKNASVGGICAVAVITTRNVHT